MACGIFQFCVMLGLTVTAPGAHNSQVPGAFIVLTTKTPQSVNTVRETGAAPALSTQFAANTGLLPARSLRTRLAAK